MFLSKLSKCSCLTLSSVFPLLSSFATERGNFVSQNRTVQKNGECSPCFQKVIHPDNMPLVTYEKLFMSHSPLYPSLRFSLPGERGDVSSDQWGHQQQRVVVGRGADLHPAAGRFLADEAPQRLLRRQETGLMTTFPACKLHRLKPLSLPNSWCDGPWTSNTLPVTAAQLLNAVEAGDNTLCRCGDTWEKTWNDVRLGKLSICIASKCCV